MIMPNKEAILMWEVVEVCPYCMCENLFVNFDVLILKVNATGTRSDYVALVLGREHEKMMNPGSIVAPCIEEGSSYATHIFV